jgi:low temperature requirement protein LtrA
LGFTTRYERNNNPISSSGSKEINRNAIIIAILSVVILVQFTKMYFDHKEKQADDITIASTEEELASTMQQLNEHQA